MCRHMQASLRINHNAADSFADSPERGYDLRIDCSARVFNACRRLR